MKEKEREKERGNQGGKRTESEVKIQRTGPEMILATYFLRACLREDFVVCEILSLEIHDASLLPSNSAE